MAAGGRGGSAAGGAPRVPSARATQEKNDFNNALRARQEAFLPSPTNAVCPTCQTHGRNAHHQPYKCAYNECAKCKRGGHRDTGADGSGFVPGLPRRHLEFWDTVILKDHPSRDVLLPYLREGVSLHNFLPPSHRGPSAEHPFQVDRFPGLALQNRIPPEFDGFVREEIGTIVGRGCVARWDDVRGATGPARPRLIMPLSMEPSKPRLIYDARSLNQHVADFPFSMDTVGRVAQIAAEIDVFHDLYRRRAAFRHIGIHTASWPLLCFSYDGVDYVWRV